MTDPRGRDRRRRRIGNAGVAGTDNVGYESGPGDLRGNVFRTQPEFPPEDVPQPADAVRAEILVSLADTACRPRKVSRRWVAR